MAYRFRDPSPTFDNLLGTRTAPGAKWHFYEIGTTVDKATFQDYELTVPNENPITLTASSRFPVPVWLDGEYTVELKAADGSSIINPTDIRPEIPPGQALPDPLGHDGEFVQSNGSGFEMSGPVWMNPDPTGSAGKIVQVNSTGDDYILAPLPEPEELTIGITVTTTSVIMTDDEGGKMRILRGQGVTAGALGTKQISGTVSYPSAFSESVIPIVSATGGPFATGNDQGGYYADVSVSSFNAGGFTVVFNTNHGESNGDGNITGQITFGFIVMGPIA